jgi:hypothetical protein
MLISDRIKVGGEFGTSVFSGWEQQLPRLVNTVNKQANAMEIRTHRNRMQNKYKKRNLDRGNRDLRCEGQRLCEETSETCKSSLFIYLFLINAQKFSNRHHGKTLEIGMRNRNVDYNRQSTKSNRLRTTRYLLDKD